MADDIWSRYGYSLPMGASPGDMIVGETEWGAPVYQSRLGAQYYEPLVAEQPRGSMIGGLASAFADDPVGTIGSGIGSLASGVWDAVSAPARAWRGEPVTNADAFNTAGVAQLGSFGATAPAGALRSGMSRDAADEIAELLVAGRGANVTDDMMAAADQVYLSSIYDLPLDEASRMARAREMGFDTGTTLYHGTDADFQAFDQRMFGKRDEGFAGRGVYSTDEPMLAEEYGGVIIPHIRASSKDFVVNPERGISSEGYDTVFDRFGVSRERDLSGANSAKLTSNAISEGYEGVWINDRLGDEVAAEVVTFDPANIRSRFARFDPRLSHLRNLSAGVAGAAAVPFGLLGGDDEQY